MKNLSKAIGIIALIAIIGFTMAGCGGPGTDGDPEPLTGTVTLGFTKVSVAVAPNVTGLNANTGFSYQWQISSTESGTYADIAGPSGTAASYTPVAADQGKWLRVKVSAADYTGEKISNAVEVQSAIAQAPTIESVSITTSYAEAQQGDTKTFAATVTGHQNPSGELSDAQKKVRWTLSAVSGTIASGTAIVETTGVLTIADNQGAAILRVTATSVIDTDKSDSTTIQVLTGSESPLTGIVSITGIIKIGDNVIANVGSLGGDGEISYQWQKSDDGMNFVNVPGATHFDYTVVAAEGWEAGDWIKVVVTRIGYTGYKESNAVEVREMGAADPVVTNVIVSPATASVSKGGTESFSATVTGTNLSGSDEDVIWSVSGSTNPGTSIDEYGWLSVAVNESAATLTVRATSTVDATKSGTATVTVTDAEGYVLSITGMPYIDGGLYVGVMDNLDFIGSEDPPIASGYGEVINNTLNVVLYDAVELEGWEGGEELFLVLVDYSSYDFYVYTNGAALNITDPLSPSATYKFNFSGDNATIGFDKFKKFELGAGGHQLTITGFVGQNNKQVMLRIVDYANGSEPTDFATGYETITGGSVTIKLADAEDYYRGWTASGQHHIYFELDGEEYLYVNTGTLAGLGITGNYSTFYHAPKYTFSGASSSIALDKFKQLPQQYSVSSGGGSNYTGFDGDGIYYAGETVTITFGLINESYEVYSVTINKDGGGTVTPTAPVTAATRSVSFIMPEANVSVSIEAGAAHTPEPITLGGTITFTFSAGLPKADIQHVIVKAYTNSSFSGEQIGATSPTLTWTGGSSNILNWTMTIYSFAVPTTVYFEIDVDGDNGLDYPYKNPSANSKTGVQGSNVSAIGLSVVDNRVTLTGTATVSVDVDGWDVDDGYAIAALAGGTLQEYITQMGLGSGPIELIGPAFVIGLDNTNWEMLIAPAYAGQNLNFILMISYTDEDDVTWQGVKNLGPKTATSPVSLGTIMIATDDDLDLAMPGGGSGSGPGGP